MLLTCLLLYVQVIGCDPRAQQYAAIAARVPPAHWALVESVEIWDHGNARYVDHRLKLPDRAKPYFLFHEVGHLVGNAYGLNGPFRDRFWPKGKPTGRTTSYAARNDAREDLADSYAAMLDNSNAVDAERKRWLRQHLGM